MSTGVRIDPDIWRSASHQAMAAHLTGPFAAGAVEDPVEVDATGRARVAVSRLPLLLVTLRRSLQTESLRVDFALQGGGAIPTVEFAPYSEAGASLPVFAPPVDQETSMAAAFTVRMSVRRISAEAGAAELLTALDATALVELRLLSGNLGRLAYCLAAEQARIRRQAREVGVMRSIVTARDDALDRHGADLAVPRLTDRISFAPAPAAPATVPPNDHRIVTIAEREADASYRRRLLAYRAFGRTTPAALRERLNGIGADGDPNRGPLAGLGVTARFGIVEDDNPFAVAIRLVGEPELRTTFLDYIRRIHLIWPSGTAAANAIHRARYLSATIQQQQSALRKRLRTSFDLQADGPMAPQLAAALDRLGAVRSALVGESGWPLLRAQDDAGGSRFELGLGVSVRPLSNAKLDALAAAVRSARAPGEDPATEALISSLAPRSAADDPDGRWLFEPCGLRTVHRFAANQLYLSHLPTFGLVVDEGPGATAETIPLEARFHAPGDPGANAALVHGLTVAAAQWQGPAWTAVPDADAPALWAAAVPDAIADGVFRAAGLRTISDAASVAARLGRLPTELVETIRLAPAMGTRIRTAAASVAAADELRALVTALREAGLSSILPLALPGGGIVLVIGVIGLPEVGLNLTDRRATGFRWYTVPIQGLAGNIRTVGSRTALRRAGPGLSAVVALGYVRGGKSDPFEYRVELPDDVLLTLEQYELLMNMLERANPIGVEINTFAIRRRHVDLDGDGVVDPLDPSAARTFRRFHRPRHRGEAAVALDETLIQRR